MNNSNSEMPGNINLPIFRPELNVIFRKNSQSTGQMKYIFFLISCLVSEVVFSQSGRCIIRLQFKREALPLS